MYTQEQAFIELRKAIEARIERKLMTPKDFDYLSECIFKKLHQSISATTLKRLWGYLSENATPRVSTLNILAQFLDYPDWNAFCQQDTATGSAMMVAPSSSPSLGKKRSLLTSASFALLLMVIALIAWSLWHPSTQASDPLILRKGQTFKTYTDYLKLFGIQDTVNHWGRVLPHHPNILVWGPEYQHPNWHNLGNPDSLMPTITERWTAADVDSTTIAMRNRDKYYHELRINEVRITFMKNLTSPSYVFLGIYRLSNSLSDTTKCVWERVAEECDLNHLDYLDELRN